MWKFYENAVSAGFRAKLYGNCAFLQNFHNRKLGNSTTLDVDWYVIPLSESPKSFFIMQGENFSVRLTSDTSDTFQKNFKMLQKAT